MKKISTILAVSVLFLVLGACEAKKKVYTINFATQHPHEAAMNKVINEAWIRWIEKESGGRIKINLIPSAQIAAPADLYDAAKTGLTDMACQSYQNNPDRFPLLEVAMLPFMFGWPSAEQVGQTLMTLYEKYPEMQAEHPGVKVLGFHSTGTYHIMTVKKPVYTMEDLKGLMLFEFGSYPSAGLAALGGMPVSIDITQAYDALGKGVADGIDTSLEGHFVFHWNELCNYTTIVGTTVGPFIHVMNMDTWNSLPPDLQKLFTDENAWRLTRLYGHQFDQDDQMYRDLLDEQLKEKGYPGVYVLPQEERARWVKAVEPIWEQWVKKAASRIGEAKARAILEDAKQLAARYEYKGFDQESEDILHEWGAPDH